MGTIAEKIAKMAKINAFHVSLFAYYLEKLKATPDGDGNLLDHALVLYGSGMGNPNIHDHVNLPIVVAGGAAGRVKGGRHIRYAEPTPLANLHLTLLERVGVRMDAFADSQGKVDELLRTFGSARAPLRRRAPFAWLTRCARSLAALIMVATFAGTAAAELRAPLADAAEKLDRAKVRRSSANTSM